MRSSLARAIVLGTVAAIGGVSVLGVACYSPTEMRVSLVTDTPCSQGTTTGIYTHAFGSPNVGAVATTTTCTPMAGTTFNSLGDLVIVPRTSRDATIEVEVRLAPDGNPDACYGAGAGRCIIARRTIAFIAHSSRILPIRLDDVCRGNYCDATNATTCVGGTCASADTSKPNFCEGPTGTVPCDEFQDAGDAAGDGAAGPPPPVDGSPSDGGGPTIVFCDANAQCQTNECCCPNLPATPACDRTLNCNVEGPGCFP